MSTGIMTGTGTIGTRGKTQERTPSRARTTDTGSIRGTGTRDRRHRLVPPRTGSLQQVSVRGRRVSTRESGAPGYLKLVVVLVILVAVGIGATMFLSGKTTEQAFVLKDAQAHSDTLSNELESLNRDYKELSSSENLAAEASRMGMVVPGQAGVLDVQGDQVNETRPADPVDDSAVIDLDATRSGVPRTDRPTTDQSGTTSDGPVATVDGDGAPVDGDSGDGAPVAPISPSAASGNGQLPY
ncbi:hypothetical protein [Corynebacterium sp.]|uniref:hypothetical protein n=1 Tax=Corynebacterium sp. TaxID=1720 RepID=UPI0025C3C9AE|nr:hypothetical protein [Corynebacterium sp.]